MCILSLSFNPYVEELTTVEKFNTERNNKEEVTDEKTGISLYCSVWSFPAYTVRYCNVAHVCQFWDVPYINLVC